jgi:hypothetical protein
MKLPSVVIIVSLSLNALLLGYLVRHRAPTASASTTSAPTPTSAGNGVPAPGADLGEAIRTHDLARLRDGLRAAGFPPDMVREIIQSRVWAQLRESINALVPPADTTAHWWTNDVDANEQASLLARENRDQIDALEKQARAQLIELLGPASSEELGLSPQLAFLPLEKRVQIQKIEDDYNELNSQIHEESRDFRTPADDAKLRLLADERQKDILSVMSPEEQKTYELRSSPTAQMLHWDLAKFKVTEAEYRAIFPLQKAFDERFTANDPFSTASTDAPSWTYETRNAEDEKLKQAIRNIIGEERYLLAIRKETNDWRMLEGAARRFNLPAETPERLYALRETASATSRQIVDNPALSAETKKQALADLATQTRKQVRSGLGEEAAAAYFKNQGMSWLQSLEEGDAVILSKDKTDWQPYNPERFADAPIIRIAE